MASPTAAKTCHACGEPIALPAGQALADAKCVRCGCLLWTGPISDLDPGRTRPPRKERTRRRQPRPAATEPAAAPARPPAKEPARATPSRAPGELPGREVRGYRFLKKLGEGAMGQVYLARQLKLKREVAIKVLPARYTRDADFIGRFEREAQVLAGLDHPNIIAVHDFFALDGRYCIAMQLAPGGSLYDRIVRRGRLPERRAAQLGEQVALALWHAAEKGVVHRDIKPDNLLVSERDKVKIADFGLVKMAETQVTSSGIIMGTPTYMSPEQIDSPRKVDHRSDLYSLGCTLYEMLCGEPPFPSDNPLEVLKQQTSQPPPPLASRGVSAGLARVVMRCLEKDPRKRFQTGKELGRALHPFAAGSPKPRRPSRQKPPAAPRPEAAQAPRPEAAAGESSGGASSWVVALLLCALLGALGYAERGRLRALFPNWWPVGREVAATPEAAPLPVEPPAAAAPDLAPAFAALRTALLVEDPARQEQALAGLFPDRALATAWRTFRADAEGRVWLSEVEFHYEVEETEEGAIARGTWSYRARYPGLNRSLSVEQPITARLERAGEGWRFLSLEAVPGRRAWLD